jgi:hypothetical protein
MSVLALTAAGCSGKHVTRGSRQLVDAVAFRVGDVYDGGAVEDETYVHVTLRIRRDAVALRIVRCASASPCTSGESSKSLSCSYENSTLLECGAPDVYLLTRVSNDTIQMSRIVSAPAEHTQLPYPYVRLHRVSTR